MPIRMDKIKTSTQNRKVGENTLVLNMTSAKDCPSRRLGLCKHPDRCYARKAEIFRTDPIKSCLKSRRKNAIIWNKLNALEISNQLLRKIQAPNRKHKIKFLRFSESGDFRTQYDVNKMNRIAEYLKISKVKVYGYTARRDLDFSSLSDNITVNGSGFMLHNQFNAVEKITSKNSCVGNCRICNKCKYTRGKIVQVKYH